MGDVIYGIREYKTSDKTKRPQKIKLDENLTEEEKQKQLKEILVKKNKELEKRNNTQKRLYITLENIDEMFSNNDRYPICYDFLFNLIQGKVTKYFKTRNYDRKKEISYDCLNRLYSIFKRKLLKLQDKGEVPVIFFYLSAFFRYVDLLVYGVIYHSTQDCKHIVQELEELPLLEELSSDKNELKVEFYLEQNDEQIKRDKIKKYIESNDRLSVKEKKLIFKIYKSCSFFGGNLTNKDKEDLQLLQEHLQLQPELLEELEDLCNE